MLIDHHGRLTASVQNLHFSRSKCRASRAERCKPMTPQTISPSELANLLSIYEVHEQERRRSDTPFLKLLAWVEQKQKNQTLEERICQPGEIIICENEPGDIFYLIRSGQAVVIKGDFQAPTILGFRQSGDAIGEMALLENMPRSATVIALNTMFLWCLSREMFYKFLGENPAFSIDLMSMLSWRVRESDEERMRGYVREKQQVEALESLSKQATRDPLTGLFNRRYLDEILRGEIVRARQNGSTVGIIMADIDHFKYINDLYGHKAGDLMLQALGDLFKKCVRTADIVCRYGGEEFVVVMPGASVSTVNRCAEEIRSKCHALRLAYKNHEIRTTISLGAATYPQHGSSGDEVLVHADQSLYRAKQEGRNRVVVYSTESDSQSVE
jgi:diguanylate cyclase (GGDEF)-like protein